MLRKQAENQTRYPCIAFSLLSDTEQIVIGFGLSLQFLGPEKAQL